MLLSCLRVACGAIVKHLIEAITSEAFMQTSYMARWPLYCKEGTESHVILDE